MKRNLLFLILTSLLGTSVYLILIYLEIMKLKVFYLSCCDIILIGIILFSVSLIFLLPLLWLMNLKIKVPNSEKYFNKTILFIGLALFESLILFSIMKEIADIINLWISYGVIGLLLINLTSWEQKIKSQ
jgi:hypothetical protein